MDVQKRASDVRISNWNFDSNEVYTNECKERERTIFLKRFPFFMILRERAHAVSLKTKWIKRGNKVQKQFKQKHFHEL